jgi:hypothetical protein
LQAITERHGYFDLDSGQGGDPIRTCELRSLISGLPYLGMASFNALTQKLVSSVFDSRYTSTLLVAQSMIATRYKNPRRTGI